MRNIDAVIEAGSGAADPEVIVVGAHYDSAEDTPGANDNGSGTAAVLEIARLLRDLRARSRKRIRFVLFVNEEPPYFQTDDMGSLRYAKRWRRARERVIAMISLETLGYYSDEPGSQQYPPPFGLMFPDKGNFIAFVGTVELAAAACRRRSRRSARTRRFPSVGGVRRASSRASAGRTTGRSGEYGFQGVMVTDTAPFRYPHYHEPTDTPDKVDIERLARIVKGIERVVRDLAR